MNAMHAEMQPAFELTKTGPTGQSKIVLEVFLPGVQSSKDIVVVIRNEHISVFVAGLYNLDVALGSLVTEQPDSLKFIRKRALLRVILTQSGDIDITASRNAANCSRLATKATAADEVDTQLPLQSRADHSEAESSPALPASLTASQQAINAVVASSTKHHQPACSTSNAASEGVEIHRCPNAAAPITNTADDHDVYRPPKAPPTPEKVAPSCNGSSLSQSPRLERASLDEPAATAAIDAAHLDSSRPPDSSGGVDSPRSINDDGMAGDADLPSDSQPRTEADSVKGPVPTAAFETSTGDATPANDADIYRAAQARLDAEAAAAFAEKAAGLMTSQPTLDETKRAIGLLQKAVRLDRTASSHQRQLEHAEHVADSLRSQQPAGADDGVPSSEAPEAERGRSPPSPETTNHTHDSSSEGHDDEHSRKETPQDTTEGNEWMPSDSSDALPGGIRSWISAFATLGWLVVLVVARFAVRLSLRLFTSVLQAETFMLLSLARLCLSRRLLHIFQGEIGKPTIVLALCHGIMTILMLCCIFIEPLLITWPFYLAAFAWRQLVWDPYAVTAICCSAVIYLTAWNIEPVLRLAIFWPVVLWACGGKIRGIAGVMSHVLLLLALGRRATSTAATLMFHGLCILFACASRTGLWIAIPLCGAHGVAIASFVVFLSGRDEPRHGGTPAETQLQSEVPEGAVGEVARVLGALSHYEVLGVSLDADEAVMQKAKRVKLLACHPDKVGASAKGAGHAVARITTALTVLCDPRSRARYDAELRTASSAASATVRPGQGDGTGNTANRKPESNRSSSGYPLYPNDPGILLPSTGKDSVMHCPRVLLEKSSARQCDTCGRKHPAKSDDIWVNQDSSWFGTRHMLFCQDQAIYDVSQWADKERIWDRIPSNSHTAISAGKRGLNQTAKAFRKKRSRRK